MNDYALKTWTAAEAMADALAKHRDCTHAQCVNGLDSAFRATIAVELWRTEECALAGDPPRVIAGGYVRKNWDE